MLRRRLPAICDKSKSSLPGGYCGGLAAPTDCRRDPSYGSDIDATPFWVWEGGWNDSGGGGGGKGWWDRSSPGHFKLALASFVTTRATHVTPNGASAIQKLRGGVGRRSPGMFLAASCRWLKRLFSLHPGTRASRERLSLLKRVRLLQEHVASQERPYEQRL